MCTVINLDVEFDWFIVFKVTTMCMEVQMGSIHTKEQVLMQLMVYDTMITAAGAAAVRAMVCTHTISTSILPWIPLQGTHNNMVPQSLLRLLLHCNQQV